MCSVSHFALERLLSACSAEQVSTLLACIAPYFNAVAVQKHGPTAQAHALQPASQPECLLLRLPPIDRRCCCCCVRVCAVTPPAPVCALCMCVVSGSFACQALVDALRTEAQISSLTSAVSASARARLSEEQLERAHEVMRQAGISLSPQALHTAGGSAPSPPPPASALSLDLHHLCTNASGHFVVLRLLARLPPASLHFVDACMAAHCRAICCDHHGLRVVKAYLAARPAAALHAFYAQVVELCPQLVEDGYGNCQLAHTNTTGRAHHAGYHAEQRTLRPCLTALLLRVRVLLALWCVQTACRLCWRRAAATCALL